jgi:nucleotide-binding universal stress UspA family protein
VSGSAEGFLLATAGIWLAIGLVLSLVMGRRGHAGFSWLLIGTALGPIALVLAVRSWREDEALRPTTLARSPAPGGTGPVDVLVGYDRSPEAAAALDAVIELLGSRLGRLTVVTVVPYDGGVEAERSAAAALESLCATTPETAADFEVLHGRPSEALGRRAAEARYDLLAVGTRGAGLAKTVFGSTASELARASQVPVLMVGMEALRAAKGT